MNDVVVIAKEFVRPDSDDARILRALQIAPRAPFAVVGSVLALSEVTVARRWRRMVTDGVARVTGELDTTLLHRSQWVVQLQCRAGAGPDLATALTRRPDVPLVATTGNDHLTFIVTARTHQQRQDLLATRIPSTRATLRQESAMILHQFGAGRGAAWTALQGVLTDEEEAAFESMATATKLEPAGPVPVQLDADDDRILGCLTEDGRASLVDLARAIDSTGGRAARLLERLLAGNLVRLEATATDAVLGMTSTAVLRLRVAPGDVRHVGSELVTSPNVSAVAAITGPSPLLAFVRCPDLEALFAFTTDTVGAIPGVLGVEVTPLLEQHKLNGRPVRDGLFVAGRLKKH